MIEIYPSLISADLLNLQNEISTLEPLCAGFHIDIMDNHFVPNLTWGAQFTNAIASATTKPLWVHLMIDDPKKILHRLKLTPLSIVSIHIESKEDITKTICDIKEKNWRPSIAVSPKTNVEEIFPFLSLGVDQVLLMSVEPGFSNQIFLESSTKKITPLIEYRKKNNLNFSIAMDGGINETNIAALAHCGVEQFAIAGGIFNNTDHAQAIKSLYKLTQLS